MPLKSFRFITRRRGKLDGPLRYGLSKIVLETRASKAGGRAQSGPPEDCIAGSSDRPAYFGIMAGSVGCGNVLAPLSSYLPATFGIIDSRHGYVE